MKKEQKGFTLIELMVVMAIIAVLAVLIIGAIQIARRSATETTNRANAKTVQTGMEAAYAKTKEYPTFTGVSLDSVKATLGISLVNTCGAGAQAEGDAVANTKGGGQITSTTTGYTITPYNYNCSAPLDNTDVLKNQ